MKILIVSPYYPPQNAVASRRVHAFACAWTEAGRSVTVVTTLKRADQQGFDAVSPGVNIVEVPYQIPKLLERLRRAHKSSTPTSFAGSSQKPERATDNASASLRGIILGAFRRFREYTGVFCSVRCPDLTDFWVEPAIQWAAAHGPWDVVVSSSGPYTAHLVALALKERRLARFWVQDFRDLWTRNHLHHGLFPFPLWEHSYESRILHNADLVATVSQPLADHLASRTQAPVEIIYNGFDPKTFDQLPREPLISSGSQIKIVYAGTYYSAGQDPRPLLEAIAHIKTERPELCEQIRLHVAGQGTERWLNLARQLNITDVLKIHGILPRIDALRLVRDASALILLDWNDPRAGVLTGKIFEYLAVSAPVFAIGPHKRSPVGELLARTKRGVHMGNNPRLIADTILGLIGANSESLLEPPDHRIINTFTRREQAMRFLGFIDSFRPG